MKPTLKDIAQKTELSISTVSRILRGDSKTSTKNVELTIKAAQELNYPINSRLLNLQYDYKQTLQIALISSFYPDEFYSNFFYGLNNAALNENITLSFYIYNSEENDLPEFIHQLINNSIDAAILFLPALQEQDYKEVLKHIPDSFSLMSMAPLFNPVLDTITFDSYRGGYLVAKHFHEKGYFDLGIINGPANKNEALLRKNGFIDYINQKHDLNLIWQFQGDYTFESGRMAFEEYSRINKKPRAIFSSNDYMCLGFLEHSKKFGIEVPNDVAIAGYDDLPICEYVHPSITSVHTDYNILGKKTFNLLKEKINSPYEHSGILSYIPVTLSKRHST